MHITESLDVISTNLKTYDQLKNLNACQGWESRSLGTSIGSIITFDVVWSINVLSISSNYVKYFVCGPEGGFTCQIFVDTESPEINWFYEHCDLPLLVAATY